MKVWLTAQEIADAASNGILPDLPRTHRGAQKLAEREDWAANDNLARPRSGREGGGGLEYHLDLLPAAARVAYLKHHMQVRPGQGGEADKLLGRKNLSRRARSARDARLVVLRAAETLRASDGLSVLAADSYFARLYNAGDIEIDPWVREIIKSVSARSLARWRAAAGTGADALGHDPAKSRTGTGVLDRAEGGRVAEFILSAIAQQPHLAGHQVRALVVSEFGDQLALPSGRTVAVPPVRTIQNHLKKVRAANKVALTKLTNPDLYRSTMAPSGTGTLSEVVRPNQLWQVDASPVDALCTNGRHSLYACVDIATRRAIVTISRTPRASAVALLIRKAVLAWGVPEKVKTDNGSDFVAKDTIRLFGGLGIEVELSDPYQPQQKGHVERFIGTLQREVTPLLPGYIGHSVADRQAIESRKSFAQRLGAGEDETFGVSLSATDLQAYFDQWIEKIYHTRAHSGLAGLSPQSAMDRSGFVPRRVDERALDVLLMPAASGGGLRTVTRFGIRIDGRHYSSPDLLPGTQVLVRHDPNDMGRVLAFDAAGATFLAEAINPELRGIHPQSWHRAMKAERAERLTEATAQVRSDMRKLAKGPALIERILSATVANDPDVLTLPRRPERHETPELRAAADAGNQSTGTVTRLAPTARSATHTMDDRFRRALEIETRREKGEPISSDEARWLAGYAGTPEYRAMRTIHEDTGARLRL